MEQKLNAKVFKRCAFCKHWYDPTNSAIQPTKLRDVWIINDSNQESLCMRTRFKKRAGSQCSFFESKL